jgi:hypothetical protein
MNSSSSSLIELLLADGPAADRADKMELYGQMVGDWNMDAVVHTDDGQRHNGRGEIRARRTGHLSALAGRR